MKIRNVAVNLPVSKIYSHPDNPRKDLGDISELADSIKKNGLMQNLTVMPGHWISKEEYIKIAKAEGVSRIDAESSYTGEEWSNEGYTLLIGHRRCAAARAAGLETVPCRIIENSTRNEQVGIMLEENMQRSDLTAFEQAEGFQLMLDLGETVETLADKTGFSKSTIYHRTNLAKLDKEILKKVDEDDDFQLNLKDLYELEKIKDVDKRNEILKKSSSSTNLKWNIEQAIKDEIKAKNSKLIEELFEKNGIKPAPEEAAGQKWMTHKWKILQEISLMCDSPSIDIELTEDVMWTKYWDSYGLIREIIEEKQEKEIDEKDARISEIKNNLSDLSEQIKDHVNDFYQLIIDDEFDFEKDISYLTQLWKDFILLEIDVDVNDLIETLGYDDLEDDTPEYEKAVEEALNMPIEKQLLIFMYVEEKWTTLFNSFNVSINEFGVKNYKKLIKAFEKHGFKLEDEEQQFLDGTHPLFDEYRRLKDGV